MRASGHPSTVVSLSLPLQGGTLCICNFTTLGEFLFIYLFLARQRGELSVSKLQACPSAVAYWRLEAGQAPSQMNYLSPIPSHTTPSPQVPAQVTGCPPIYYHHQRSQGPRSEAVGLPSQPSPPCPLTRPPVQSTSPAGVPRAGLACTSERSVLNSVPLQSRCTTGQVTFLDCECFLPAEPEHISLCS